MEIDEHGPKVLVEFAFAPKVGRVPVTFETLWHLPQSFEDHRNPFGTNVAADRRPAVRARRLVTALISCDEKIAPQ